MQGANKTLVNILLGLIIAVIVGVTINTARAATLNYITTIDTLQGGTGNGTSPFVI